MVRSQPILTVAEMRARESASAVAEGELMERAGRGIMQALRPRRPDLLAPGRRAVVLCGPGNNGGDGYVVGRLLAEAGVAVMLLDFGAPATPPASDALRRWTEAGGAAPRPLQRFEPDWDQPAPDLLVDALFGGGLSRPLPDALSESLVTIEELAPCGVTFRLAIDAPSGLNLDTGAVMVAERDPQIVLECDLTVTFDALRPGHLLGAGPALCGAVEVAELGIPLPLSANARTIPAPSIVDLDPAMELGASPHKYHHGHVLVLAGRPGRGGAARLAARAALRAGAGLVTVACPADALTENAARLDAIMLGVVDDADGLAALLEDKRITMIVAGPGLGLERAHALVPVALASGRACVLDADALTAFADDPQALFAHITGPAVLTPHGGEFARLFSDLADAPPIEAARQAARRSGAVVVLKGPVTIVGTPGGLADVLDLPPDPALPWITGTPWLATAGTGDVLAGMIAGLGARLGALPQAAPIAVWLHAMAARRIGRGLIAEDIPEALPALFRSLTAPPDSPA